VVAAVVSGLVFALLPGPFSVTVGLILGAAVAVFAPLGDLAVSTLKRSLAVKDMGTVLPGHGGILDRIDAMLFAFPAAWVVFAAAGLLV
ncbi:MAG: phosphatidate cytidylyltransferase, partial [Acidimicrobiia bacterium]|nr:phosphatidate cytidylyltransferase [Acidimicrobiia bacterium]